ncbi:unnamed protein product [Sympodiomycopsis kandeliae]
MASSTDSAFSSSTSSSSSITTEASWHRVFSRYLPANHDLRLKSQQHTPLEVPFDGSGSSRVYSSSSSLSSDRRRIRTSNEHEQLMTRIRRLILTSKEGIPVQYRPLLWKLLLNVKEVSSNQYLALISLGPSPSHFKIRNDTFRTLATDMEFKSKVKEDSLIRLLDAFVWKWILEQQRNQQHGKNQFGVELGDADFTYVQGMNVLAAPFLYTCQSEMEAFCCFSAFIEHCCPTYVRPTLSGVHQGLKLVDICLSKIDSPLYNHLRSKNLTAELYAFPSLLTLSACTPPLDQVLKLWDFYLAFGIHLNVVSIVSQLLLMRESLMESASPMKLLRNWPVLDADRIIEVAVRLCKDLDEGFYHAIVQHPILVNDDDDNSGFVQEHTRHATGL